MEGGAKESTSFILSNVAVHLALRRMPNVEFRVRASLETVNRKCRIAMRFLSFIVFRGVNYCLNRTGALEAICQVGCNASGLTAGVRELANAIFRDEFGEDMNWWSGFQLTAFSS